MFAHRLTANVARQARLLPRVSTTPTTSAVAVAVRNFTIGANKDDLKAPLDNKFYPVLDDVTDPRMNGGYPNPIPERRQFRDPYADWWDKQERRNYGEPLHEDNDILGRFSPEEYTWIAPGKGLAQIGMFVVAVFGLCGVVYSFYPDKPAVARRFPHNGLEVALGGKGAVPALPEN